MSMDILAASSAVRAAAEGAQHAYRSRQPIPRDSSLTSVVARWCRAVERGANAGPALSAGRSEVIGRDFASIVHVRAHGAFDSGGATFDSRALTAVELAYRTRLGALREAARAGSLKAVGQSLRLLLGPDLARLEAVCAATGSAADSIAQGAARVRATQLARSTAGLAAGAVALQRRLVDARLRSTTADLAARRETLSRGHVAVLSAAPGFALAPVGTRLAVIARATSITWIDRPERPYTRFDLADGSQIRVHFRNLRAEGLSGTHWLWVRAKVEQPDDGIPYAVAEFEGPTATAGEVWEDWLQVEARDAYDVSPRSVDLVTDFPDLAAPHAPLDLYARTTRRDA